MQNKILVQSSLCRTTGICPEIFEQQYPTYTYSVVSIFHFILWFRNFRELYSLKKQITLQIKNKLRFPVESNHLRDCYRARERREKSQEKKPIIIKKYISFYINEIANDSISVVSVSSTLNVSDAALSRSRLVNVPDAVLTSS